MRLPGWLFAMLALGACAWCWSALGTLSDARADERAARVAGLAPRIVGARPLRAADARGAGGALARLLGDRAAAMGVRLTLRPPGRAEPAGLAVIAIEASGPELSLRRFARAVEDAPGPMVRLAGWTMRAGPAGVDLAAEALATWAPPGGGSGGGGGPAIRLPAPTAEIVPDTRALFAAAPLADVRPGTDAPALVGIAGRLPDDAVALLRLPDDTTRTLRTGEAAGGWRLAAIAADRVRLTRGAEQRVLVLPARTESDGGS